MLRPPQSAALSMSTVSHIINNAANFTNFLCLRLPQNSKNVSEYIHMQYMLFFVMGMRSVFREVGD
jgi:hypothetical protein